jgi:hypothetical protein
MGVVVCSWLGMEVGCHEMFEEDWVVSMNETDLLDGSLGTWVVDRIVGNLVSAEVGKVGWVGGVGLGCVKINEDSAEDIVLCGCVSVLIVGKMVVVGVAELENRVGGVKGVDESFRSD